MLQVLDVLNTVSPDYQKLEEISLFLLQPGSLDAGAALALYVSVGGAEWQYRGYVSSSHPSEVMPLQWPEPTPSSSPTVQLGVSLEPEGVLSFIILLHDVTTRFSSVIVSRSTTIKFLCDHPAVEIISFFNDF